MGPVAGNKKPRFTGVVVGVAGFEPTTSCSQSRRDTGLRYTPNSLAVRGGFEPPVPLLVRQFSKLLVSATHPPHQGGLQK